MTQDVAFLQKLLDTSLVEVQFEKADGSIRVLLCTRNEKLVNHLGQEIPEGKNKRKPNDDLVVAWDIENAGWRSFRKDSILTFKKTSNAPKSGVKSTA